MKPVPRPTTIHRKLLSWYSQHKRDLPWRRTRDPYAILISEVMLQQTQVDRVIPKYHAWLKAFPTMQSLARAPLRRVLKLWSGLGYNSRALRLREMARIVVEKYGGKLPVDRESLEVLPGIGRYTAGAVLTFAYKKSVGVVDTNVRRVIGRVKFGVRGAPNEKKLQAKVDAMVPKKNADQWNHALMDLGATVCVSRRPKCEMCPLQKQCRAYPKIISRAFAEKQLLTKRLIVQQVPFESTDRYWRGQIIRTLIEYKHVQPWRLQTLLTATGDIDSLRLRRLLKDLQSARLITATRSRISLAA